MINNLYYDSALEDFLKRMNVNNEPLDLSGKKKRSNRSNYKILNEAEDGITNSRTMASNPLDFMGKIGNNNSPMSSFNSKPAVNGVSSGSATKGGGGAMGILAVAGAVGNAIPQGDKSDKVESGYFTEGELENTQTGDAIKDAVGEAIPMAGIFRGIEKGGVAIAQKTGGDQHATISQAMFDPIGGIIETIADDDMSGGEKALGIVGAFVAPWVTGDLLHKARLKRQLKFQKKKNLATNLFEKNKLEEEYRMEQGLESMGLLKGLREKQLGIYTG